MPICHRCRAMLASAEVCRVRLDAKKVPPGSHVCKDKFACKRRRVRAAA